MGKVKLRTVALLLPALTLVLGLFLGGMILSASKSLPLFTYTTIFADPEVRAAFGFTLVLTIVSTALSTLCGLAAAIALHRFAKSSSALKALLQIPLSVPHLAAAFVLLNLFSPSGLIARFFVSAPQDFPVLVNDAYGIGISIAYIFKEAPFVALVVLATLARTGDEFDQVAQNLGASRWQRFRFVTLPLVAPAMAFSSLLVFAFVFGAFEIPYVLGRQFPTVLAIVGNRKFTGTDLNERPEAFAIAVLMTIVAAFFAWLYLHLSRKRDQAEGSILF